MNASTDPTGEPAPRRRLALLAYGFRPFFALAALHAAVVPALWLATRAAPPAPAWASPWWHAHEMLFGFVAAAIGGFLLTAVPSWTGRRGFAGMPLALLALAWLAGRAVTLAGAPPGWAALDLVYVPALALAIAPSLIRSRAARNYPFLALLALLLAANVLYHLGHAVRSTWLALDTVLVLVTLVGGRIVPAFTGNALRRRGETPSRAPAPGLDRAVLALTSALLVADQAPAGGALAGALAAAAALAHGIRLARWEGHRVLGEPLVWVLHAGYAWIPVGLALKAAAGLGAPVALAAWVHALTAGAFATMILAVMGRATLGHTGRPLVAPAPLALAFVLVGVGALGRVAAALAPGAAGLATATALVPWSGAFWLFLWACGPMLVAPRADGRPG